MKNGPENWVQRMPPKAVDADTRYIAKIPLRDLIIDPRRQREVDYNHVKYIYDNFSWRFMGILEVTPIGGGQFRVMEGQHRKLAAEWVDPDASVNCNVHPDVTLPQESEIALFTSWTKKRHSAYEGWRLRKNMNDPHVIAAEIVLEERGLQLGSNTTMMVIGAAAKIDSIIRAGKGRTDAKFGAVTLSRTLDIIRQAYPDNDDLNVIDRWHAPILGAIGHIVSVNADKLDDARLAKKVGTVRGAKQWVTNAREGAREAGQSSQAKLGGRFVLEYNKGLPMNSERRIQW